MFSDWNARYKISHILTSFLRPVSSGWWFVTAYIILILVCPLINNFINLLSKQGFIFFLIFVWAFYYSIDYIIFKSAYLSLVRAFFFYILGSFVRLYLPKEISNSKKFFLILICVITWAIMSFCSFKTNKTNYVAQNLAVNKEISFIIKNKIFHILNECISLPIFALCFFRIFDVLKVKNLPLVNKIASATFGVYLLHDSVLGRKVIWNHILKVSEVQFTSKYFSLFALTDILIVFSVCLAIDLIRQKFIEKKYLLLEEKISQKLKKFIIGKIR